MQCLYMEVVDSTEDPCLSPKVNREKRWRSFHSTPVFFLPRLSCKAMFFSEDGFHWVLKKYSNFKFEDGKKGIVVRPNINIFITLFL